MANPGDFAYTLKQQADIVRIIGDYVKLKKAGAQNFSGLCPFHNEKTASFSVHATRQFYHCFGCGASGDVFSFVQKIENITFPEAVRLVAQKLGVPMPKQHFDSPHEAAEAKLRGQLIELHEKACAFFEEQLRRPEAAHAREYLKNRGLSEEAIRIFRIGYAPDSGFLLRDRFKGQYDEELLKASGLFSWKQGDEARPTTNDQRPTTLYSKFRNRVLFPISNESGKIIAFTGRTLATDEKSGPKYLNSPETAIYSKGRVLYNLDRAKEAVRKLDSVILVEGQMDCISVFMAGQHNVIASSGTAFTEAQVHLLGRYTKRIIVNFDPDTAGAAAAERSLAMLVAEDFSIKVATLDPGFDPDLFVRKKGRDAYITVLQRAPKYFDYLIDRAVRQFPPHSPEAKVKAVNFLLPHIQRVPNRIVRDELANDIAQKLAIDSALLRQELRHSASARTPQLETAGKRGEPYRDWIEERLIRAAYADGDRFDLRTLVKERLLAERLHEGLPSESLLEKLIRADDDHLHNLDLSVAERHLLANSVSPVKVFHREDLTETGVRDALETLSQRKKLTGRLKMINREIAEAERRGDSVAVAALIREKQQLSFRAKELEEVNARPLSIR